MNRAFDRWLIFGLVLILAVLLVDAGVTYHNTRQIHENAFWVAHTDEALDSLDDVLSTMKDAETGQRGFVITGEEGYLKPYEDALATVDGKVERVRQLTGDDSRQQARLPQLQELVRGKLDELTRTLALRKGSGFEAAQKEVLTHLGKSRMDALRSLIADMKADEKDLLVQRQQANDRAYRYALLSGALGALLGLAAVASFTWLLRRHLVGRMNAAAILHQQREWFRTTLTSIGDAVIATDNSGRVTFVNAVAESLTGRKAAEAQGQPLDTVFKIVNEQTRQPVENPALRALREGQIVGLANHTVLISKMGIECPIDDSAAPIRDEQGRVVGVVLVFRDVTQRRHAEQELRRVGEQIRSVVDSVIDGIITINENGTVQTFNPAAEKLFGYTAAEVIGQNVKMLMPAPYQDGHDGYITNFLRTGVAKVIGIGREVVGRRKDGSTFPMDLGVNEFRAQHERCFTGIVRDVSDRKRWEQVLKEADRRKDEFLATLAHELRNPLAPLRNAVDLLRVAPNDGKLLEEVRSIMERQLGQMVRLIDDLLDVSRVTAGKLQLRLEQVELAVIIEIAVETARPLLQESDHQLTVTLPPEPICLDADPVRLAQVFSNLLNNAAKYTEHGGHIWLSAQRQGSDIVVSVRDTGIGIAAEHLPHIFQTFSQVSSALDRSQGGLGLGLSLAIGIAKLHGGVIEAHSDGVGLGSEFVVRLPLVVAPLPTSPQPSGDEQPEQSKAKCRVLIVDDNRDAANSLAMMLRIRGHDSLTAYDGLEAVQAAATFRPDVLLLDIGLPTLSGYEAAQRIRQQPWGRKMALIALTGWGQEGDKQRALEAGFDQHLTKPVEPAALEKLLALIAPLSQS